MLDDIAPASAPPRELTQLHATTCALMTRFINGHHCPKLAQLIVQHLHHLLAHPHLISSSRTMYRQLEEHWRSVASSLTEQQGKPNNSEKLH